MSGSSSASWTPSPPPPLGPLPLLESSIAVAEDILFRSDCQASAAPRAAVTDRIHLRSVFSLPSTFRPPPPSAAPVATVLRNTRPPEEMPPLSDLLRYRVLPGMGHPLPPTAPSPNLGADPQTEHLPPLYRVPRRNSPAAAFLIAARSEASIHDHKAGTYASLVTPRTHTAILR
uniref:Uncharacterized protein n=1 Tax=Oryza punctata TaxID=4537 RepID=A0A0E0KZU4_ORYPU